MTIFSTLVKGLLLFLCCTALFIPNINMEKDAKNVLGTALEACCTDPLTGYYRDGYCHTGPTDHGRHVVCAVMTKDFLDYTLTQGNDLCTALPQYNFPGLKPGDSWCLCALRWKEAYLAGKAPPVVLESSNAAALKYVTLEMLQEHVYQTKED